MRPRGPWLAGTSALPRGGMAHITSCRQSRRQPKTKMLDSRALWLVHEPWIWQSLDNAPSGPSSSHAMGLGVVGSGWRSPVSPRSQALMTLCAPCCDEISAREEREVGDPRSRDIGSWKTSRAYMAPDPASPSVPALFSRYICLPCQPNITQTTQTQPKHHQPWQRPASSTTSAPFCSSPQRSYSSSPPSRPPSSTSLRSSRSRSAMKATP